MSRGLNTTFILHAIVSFVFGVALFFFSGDFSELVGWTPYDPGTSQAFGAAMLALAVSSWLGARAGSFSDVKILVQMEIVFTVLGAISSIYQVTVAGGPAFQWVSFSIYTVFACLWIYFYRQGVKAHK